MDLASSASDHGRHYERDPIAGPEALIDKELLRET